MASPIEALDKILQYQLQSDRADVQEALAFMQFAQQKRASEVKEFGIKMEVLGNANKQLKYNVANQFLQNSGLQSVLDRIPTGLEEVGEIEDSLGDIVKLLKKKQYGKFNETNATNIASALWSYKNTQEPSSIVNLANNIESMWSPSYKPSKSDKNLLKAFNKISDVSSLRIVGKQAKQSLQNQSNILKEQFEFARGDTKIQSGFGMFSPEVAKEFEKTKQPISDDIVKLADGFESSLKQDKDAPKQLQYYNNLTDSIKDDKDELSKLKNQKISGYEVDDSRIKQLSIEIDENVKERNQAYALSRDLAREENIQKTKESIDLLAEKILEDNELEATSKNLSVAKSKAAAIIRQPPSLQFEQNPAGFRHQRPAYDSFGRILR